MGSAISGMTSFSDAGLHMEEMNETYIQYWKQATYSIAAEMLIVLGMIYLSVRKPFGKRETKPFKYHNVVLAVSLLCVVVGSVVLIQSDARMKKFRNYPIEDIDVSQVADGTYEGTAATPLFK